MAFKQVRLGDYFKFEKGLGYKGEFLAEDSDIALIGMDSHEEGGGYKENSEKFYTGPYKPENIAEVGDVIFAGTEQGFGLLASPLMVPESEKFTTYLFSGDVLKAVPLKPDEFSIEYLYNIYRVASFRVKAAYGDSGTTVRRISNENMGEQMVPLPDLSIQLAINETISIIDQQIANNKLLAKNLISLCHSKYISTISSSSLKNKVKLTEIADVKFGAPFSSKCFNITAEGKPLIRIRDLQPQKIELWTTESLTKGFMAHSGDLLIGMDGDFSPYLWFGEDAWVNQRITKICPTSNLGILFLYFELLTIMRVIQHGSSGSTVSHLSKGELESIEISQLTKDEALEFHKVTNPCFETVKLLKENNMNLNRLLTSLLPSLISGTTLISLESVAS